MPKDLYLQPDAPDPVLSDAFVLSLVRRHVPDAKAVTGVDESGGEARTYAVDQHIILKTQRPHRLRPRTSLEKEVCFLNHLAAHAEVSVPRVHGYGRADGVEYTCMSRMTGVAVVTTTLMGAGRTDALRQLGKTLRRIHQVGQSPLVGSGLLVGDRTFADLKVRLEEAFDSVVERLSDAGWMLALAPEQIAARAVQSLQQTDEFVALHSNPGPTHTFIHPTTGAFSGLIDFGDAYISHPALDLRQWPLPEDRRALFEGYTADEPVSESFLAVWTVTMVLADMAAIAYRRADPEQLAAELTKRIERL